MLFSCILAFCIVIGSLSSAVMNLKVLVSNPRRALPYETLCNDITGNALHLGSVFLWFALCFGKKKKTEDDFVNEKRESWTHSVLTMKLLGGHDFLAGGFAPRMFACTMGIVLFLTGNLLTPLMVKGVKFTKPIFQGGLRWPDGMGCRANSKQLKAANKMWFARLRRELPQGCLGAPLDSDHWSAEYFWVKPNKTIPNLAIPYSHTLANGTVVAEAVVDPKNPYICWYQCSKWKPLAFQSLLKNSGSILAGAVFIEKLTNTLTAKFGYKFVTRDSSTEEVRAIIERSIRPRNILFRWIPAKRLACLLGLSAIASAIAYITPLIDKDGFYSIDYYVTQVFLFAFIFAWVLRNFHPHEFVTMAYTDALWRTGKDSFLGSAGQRYDIDLYEWFHLSANTRARYLIKYAREVGLKKVKLYKDETTLDGQPAKKEKTDGKGEKCASTSTTPMGELNQQLLNVEERLKYLEDGAKSSKPTSTPTDKESDLKAGWGVLDHITFYFDPNKKEVAKEAKKEKKADPNRIVCTSSIVGFTDVFQPDHTGRCTAGKWVRCRVTIEKDAQGSWIGKTQGNLLMVLWDNKADNNDDSRDLVKVWKEGDESDNQSGIDKTVDSVHLATDPACILEYDKEWMELAKYIDDKEPSVKDAMA